MSYRSVIKMTMSCKTFGSLISGIWWDVLLSAKMFIGPTVLTHGEGNGTPRQHSCLENPMDGGAWWAAVHGVAKSRTRLSDFTFTFHFHALEKEMATHSSVLVWKSQGWGSLVGTPAVSGVTQSRTRLMRLSSSANTYYIKSFRCAFVTHTHRKPLTADISVWKVSLQKVDLGWIRGWF